MQRQRHLGHRGLGEDRGALTAHPRISSARSRTAGARPELLVGGERSAREPQLRRPRSHGRASRPLRRAVEPALEILRRDCCFVIVPSAESCTTASSSRPTGMLSSSAVRPSFPCVSTLDERRSRRASSRCASPRSSRRTARPRRRRARSGACPRRPRDRRRGREAREPSPCLQRPAERVSAESRCRASGRAAWACPLRIPLRWRACHRMRPGPDSLPRRRSRRIRPRVALQPPMNAPTAASAARRERHHGDAPPRDRRPPPRLGHRERADALAQGERRLGHAAAQLTDEPLEDRLLRRLGRETGEQTLEPGGFDLRRSHGIPSFLRACRAPVKGASSKRYVRFRGSGRSVSASNSSTIRSTITSRSPALSVSSADESSGENPPGSRVSI